MKADRSVTQPSKNRLSNAGSPVTVPVVFSDRRAKWLLVALAVAIPLGFAAFTQHAWEDYFITLRSSRNLVEGNGLVFNPGDRLHTFTSPLGVLVPALCIWLSGVGHDDGALWIFRVINAGLLAGAVTLAWDRVRTAGLGTIGRVVFFGLLLADAKLIDFATNGMETALLVFFLLLLWSELESPDGPRAGRLALAFGGLMWTRPDAFILAGVLVGPHFLFRSPANQPIRASWNSLWRGALLGGLLYVPWFVWAWWYYGTPVPNTITAKLAYTPPIHFHDLLILPLQTLTGHTMLLDFFLPTYWFFGGWPLILSHFSHGLTVVAAFSWLLPGWSATGRRLSLAVFLGMFYLRAIILFPWYIPPWSILASLAIAFAFDRVYTGAFTARHAWLKSSLRILCVLVVLVQATMLVASAWQMRIQQRVVETGVRRQIGEWLHQNAAPGDTVFLEPLGYIGYFSQLKTYDFPGLSSREVVATVRGGAKSYVALIAALRPKWIVLRPTEAARGEFTTKRVLDDYQLVKSWNGLPQLDAVDFLPGRAWSEFESRYLLYQRKPSAMSAP